MKTFVILTRRASGAAEDLKRLEKPEVLHGWRGSADVIVRAVRGLAEGPGAALELASGTVEDPRQHIEALPFAKGNPLHLQCCALAPLSGYEGLLAS
jgi:hypothetical protein